MTAEEQRRPIEGTGLIAAKCPTCGAILPFKKGDAFHCEFCGGTFFLRESYKGKSEEIRNYYDLAYAAQEAGDAVDADRYFSKVLELDTTDALAWCGRGLAALRYSKAQEITAKAVPFFKRALANVAEEERERLQGLIQERCFRYADSVFSELGERGLLPVYKCPEIWALIEFADEVIPLDTEQLKRLVTILRENSAMPSPERKGKMDYYVERIRAAEPEYPGGWGEVVEYERRERRTLWSVIIVLITVAGLAFLFYFLIFLADALILTHG